MGYVFIAPNMFQGLYTALITPFDQEEKIDFPAFDALIEEQILAGVSGVVVVGTTGESPTLSHEENSKLIERAVKISKGRTQIIGGTGSNSTSEAISMTKRAEKSGVDGVLLVCPYYNKPTQHGLFLHFEAIANACPKIPVILYNVPGRSGVRMEKETILKLAKIPNIVSLKDATGSCEQLETYISELPEDFSLLSGDDALTLEMMEKGAKGVISVASNLYPKEIQNILSLALKGKMEEAKKEDKKWHDFYHSCFLESNPIPIKAMMAMAGKCEEIFRLPLCPPSEKTRETLRSFL